MDKHNYNSAPKNGVAMESIKYSSFELKDSEDK